MMEWSEMLPELLVIIAQKHIVLYEDYLSFASVCKSWHSASVEVANKVIYSNGLPSRLPSLLLSEKKEDDEFRELFFLSNESIRKIRLPEAYSKSCMSSCGWLSTVGDDNACRLVNPLSHEIINLPNLDTIEEFVETSAQWEFGIRKLLFLAQSSIVVVLWGNSCKLAFCRIGDNNWTYVETGWGGQMYDITYYNGRVYSIDCNSYIRAWDVYGKDPTIILKMSRLPKDVYNEPLDGAYILGLDDDEGRKRLLIVVREGMFDDIENMELCYEIYKTKSFKVFEYDLESEKWSKVKDLGRKTLFVGFSSSFWVEDTSGVIKGNCIYYTDDVTELYRFSKNGGGRDMGIYHMSNGTIEPYFTGKSCSNFIPPFWLQSM